MASTHYILYHGTSSTFAAAIVGPPPGVDVTRGSGEFGQGFYMTPAKGRAATLAINRSSKNIEWALVRATITVASYASLKVRELDHAASDRLRAACEARALVGVDVVIGTIKNRPRDLQHKFETAASEALLKTPGTLTLESQ